MNKLSFQLKITDTDAPSSPKSSNKAKQMNVEIEDTTFGK